MATVKQLLQHAQTQLSSNPAQASDAAIDAKLLLGHVLKKAPVWMMTWPDNLVNRQQQSQFQKLLAQRVAGQPLAYLLGEWGFMDFTLEIGPGVLVPRPETELLVELASRRIPSTPNCQILDLGTGSGAIAIALARLHPQAQIHAVEQSQQALTIAQRNCEKLAPSVKLHWGSWYEPLMANHSTTDSQPLFDVIVSNPPYIGAQEPELGELQYEPAEALIAANNGLEDLAAITQQAPNWLTPQGWLLVEHGYQQATAVQKMLNDNGFIDISTERDMANQPRVTLGRKP